MRRFSSTIVLLACLGALLAGCGIGLPDHTPPATAKQAGTMKAS